MKGLINLIVAVVLISAISIQADAKPADLNGDHLVNLPDFALLAADWLRSDVSDITGDRQMNWIDLRAMAVDWLWTDVPEDMVWLPGGTFQMGDSFSEGDSDQLPVHTVTLNSFYISRTEATNSQYCRFLNYTLGSGIYVFGGVVYGSGNNQPYCNTHSYDSSSQIDYSGSVFSVRTKGGRDMSNDPMAPVSWFGAAAYCNWRSQQEGKDEFYNLSTWECNFNKKGYKLPTEAQWEYAARGGLSGRRFPWGDTISHSQANYYSSSSYFYDISPTRDHHPTWNDGIYPYTSPTGSFAPNGYCLYDMAGNVREWCNDWYSGYSSNPVNNPTGPDSGSFRIIRGGCWLDLPFTCRVAHRDIYWPEYMSHLDGFRVALDLN